MIGARTQQVRTLLAPYLDTGVFTNLEVHAAERIAGASLEVFSAFDVLSVACAVWATQQGHVCFDITDDSLWKSLPKSLRPDIGAWESYLGDSILAHRATSWTQPPDLGRPLVSYDRKIFLTRQWIDEELVARILRQRMSLQHRHVDIDIVDALFATEDRGEPQYEGVVKSLRSATSILMGGPGTGKTYTIARILVAAVRHGVQSIALAAPTAKAAVQMRDSLTAALGAEIPGLESDQRRLLEKLEPTTIHRLLGHRSGSSTRFRHDSTRTLPHDLIVIDEMSMVSLPLMARLLDAIAPSASLVLVGDPGQLDSVENGSILRDLAELDLGPLVPTTILQISRRNAGTRSSAFADAVRGGDSDRALAILEADDVDGTLKWIDTPDPLAAVAELSDVIDLWRRLRRAALDGDVDGALATVNAARVLCPHRDGHYGVDVWNEKLTTTIHDTRDRWRVGDIVVKTRNDLGQGLANGDIGVVVRINGALVFAFRHGDASVHVPVAIDDAVQLAFATTVHKAQGSEFSTVAVVIPTSESPLSTRELLYTAMTRAKPRAVLIGTRDDIAHAIETRRIRSSGLASRLSIA